MRYALTLGNKNYSSWSLRGWLLFEPFGIPFEHIVIPLHTEAFADFANATFPAKQVPTLCVEQGGENITIWDSLSIAEFLHKNHPEAGIWPRDIAARRRGQEPVRGNALELRFAAHDDADEYAATV